MYMYIRCVLSPSQDVGWRNDSLRMVMVLTDAGFKTALDGKVAHKCIHTCAVLKIADHNLLGSVSSITPLCMRSPCSRHL